MKFVDSFLQRLFVLAGKKGAEKVLAAVAFAESIFFPIPPDLLLIPIALANVKKAFRYAAICLIFSVLGGIGGYFVGLFFMDVLGLNIISFYGLEDKYKEVQLLYEKYNVFIVILAGLTPLPYKLCTLTAGAFYLNFPLFLIASIIGRGARFFLVAGLIRIFGEKVRYFLEKRFDLFLIASTILGILGVVALKYI